jgi:ribosome biogenesis GTPase
LRAHVIFTKPDLGRLAGIDDTSLLRLYNGLGYPSFAIDPRTPEGARALADSFADAATLLIGQSGVGKSSLFRALGGEAEVGDVSKIGRGKQTTTTGRLFRFPGGFLIDSPGVGEFGLDSYSDAEIGLGFVEFARAGGPCRFVDCRHRTEPGCVVRAAVEAGTIAPSRYASYRAILEREDARRSSDPHF